MGGVGQWRWRDSQPCVGYACWSLLLLRDALGRLPNDEHPSTGTRARARWVVGAMAVGGRLRRALIPLIAALLATGLGVVVNLTTDWKTDWRAWAAVGVLTIASATVAYVGQGHGEGRTGGGVATRTSGTSTTTSTGLVLRSTIVSTDRDGSSSTEVIEIFDEQVALLRLRPPQR